MQFQITLEDYLETQRVGVRNTPQRRGWIAMQVVGIFILALSAGVAILDHNVSISVPGLIIGVIWVFYPYTVLPFLFSRNFRKQPSFRLNACTEVDEASFRVSNELSKSELKWEIFERWVESKNLYVVILRGTPHYSYIVPKRSFAAGEEAQFRDLLTRKIPANK